jgi:CBS domain containing-hemolysin-like protein
VISQTLFLQLAALILGTLLLWVRAVRFEAPRVTEFELKRLEQASKDLQVFVGRLPSLVALQYVLGSFLLLLLTVTVLGLWGMGWGLLAMAGIVLLLELLTRTHAVQSAAGKLFHPYAPHALRLTTHLDFLLKHLRDNPRPGSSAPFYSRPEFLHYVEHDKHALSMEEKRLVIQALRYSEAQTREIMTPKKQMQTVGARETLGPVTLDRLHKTGHTRFPVIDREGNITGILYLQDLVPLTKNMKHVQDAAKADIYYVRDDHTLDHVLHAFLRTKQHLFIVVNEFQEVVGLVTIEDVLEQLLGRKVTSEFDEYHDPRAVASLEPQKSLNQENKL